MSDTQEQKEIRETPSFRFTETSVIPFKSFKDYQFDQFFVKDIVNNKLFIRLRLSFYFKDSGNTYYTFIELAELENILAAFDFLLEKAQGKAANFVEYDATTQYGLVFGSYFVKKEGWNFFLQFGQDVPRIYPKEKEFSELHKILIQFRESVLEEFSSDTSE